MCDQLRQDYLSCYGHQTLETPNIDALATRGVRFENAFCQAPLCAPSRASFYTGRYQFSHGVCGNEDATRLGEYMLADYLRPLGYRTAVVGKTHSYKSQADLLKFGVEPSSDLAQTSSTGGFEPYEKHEGLYPDPLFEKNNGYTQYLHSVGFDDENPWQTRANSGIDENGELHSGWSLRSSVYPASVSEVHSETAYTTRRAMDFIDETQDQPWCLHLSYIKPHWPIIAPAPYHKLFGKQDIQQVVQSRSEIEDPHPVIKAFRQAEYSQNYARQQVREVVIPAYMGLVKQIDDHIGNLMKFVDERGLSENTMVIFTSDHGDYLGDHWLGEKDLFYAPSVNIPMLVVDPDEKADVTRNTVCQALAEAVDVVPTVVEVAGGKVCRERVEGRSLLPHLRNSPQGQSWREYAVSEINYADRGARYLLGTTTDGSYATMIRDQRWKYIHYQGFGHQLFDLELDPDELVDLGSDTKSAVIAKRMRDALFDWQCSLKRRVGMDFDVAQSLGPEADEVYGIIIGRW